VRTAALSVDAYKYIPLYTYIMLYYRYCGRVLYTQA
jgi:hypothetical protein